MVTFLMIIWVILLAFVFAKVEIQIEGPYGWAANLPTWRIEKHWLLDLFFGGRPLTGYHFWMFTFMFLVFHLPPFIIGTWSWSYELRVIGCLALFWIVEDFLWFLLNKNYGLTPFLEKKIPWHKRWFLCFPVDYWVFGSIAILSISLS